jgi:hypothetical protein
MFGGFASEGLALAAALRRSSTWPWRRRGEPRLGAFLIAVAIRLIVGSGLALAMYLGDQISTISTAVILGFSAPLIFESAGKQLARRFGTPLEDSVNEGSATPNQLGACFDPHHLALAYLESKGLLAPLPPVTDVRALEESHRKALRGQGILAEPGRDETGEVVGK